MKALCLNNNPFLKAGKYYIIYNEDESCYLIKLGQGVWQSFPKKFFKRLDEIRNDKLNKLGI
jgi:hypothetical protein